ncbi:MAG: peptide deformylase [Planctomycetes bacterium]|nr:peptide deformylase [Planctomycetota bacterium]MBI4007616.1 peptide deformylase [Planctomycetota bacterium]
MEIVIYPAPVLRLKAKPVEEIDDTVSQRAEEMLELMYEAKGVGLAAPQIGWSKRLIVKDVAGEKIDDKVFINPVIIEEKGEVIEEEGCLSFPGVLGKVMRAEQVVVIAYNLKGERLEFEAVGLDARVWQHEIDHIDGRLFIDKMSPASRLAVSGRLKELEREYQKRQSSYQISAPSKLKADV